MKKIVILFLIMMMAVVAFAQRAIIMPPNATFVSNRIAADDTVSGTAVKTYVLETTRNKPFTYDIQLRLDSLSVPAVNSGVSVQLMGKKFETDSWTNVGSAVVWKSLGIYERKSDTTFTISETTAVRWRYLAVKVTGAGTQKTKVSRVAWKFWE
jgi:hypothetical protein